MKFSACIEMLFSKQSSSYARRIELTKQAGLETVEFWGWLNKDIDAIEQALTAHDINLLALIAEPMLALTNIRNLRDYLIGLGNSVNTAKRLGAKLLIAQAGNIDASRSMSDQRADLISTLKAAGTQLQGTGVKLALEPLNTRYDHAGYFLSSTVEALDIIDEVNSPNIGLLYDLYHSAVMDEHPQSVIADRIDRILHVHVADHPGRNEPGSGIIDLRSSAHWLIDNGYDGHFGLEFKPTGNTIDALKQTFKNLA